VNKEKKKGVQPRVSNRFAGRDRRKRKRKGTGGHDAISVSTSGRRKGLDKWESTKSWVSDKGGREEGKGESVLKVF